MLKLGTMQIKREDISSTKIKLTIIPNSTELLQLKDKILHKMGTKTKVPGFRQGKAPLHVIEKHLNSTALQTEFIDEAISSFYLEAIQTEKLKPFGAPQIVLTKFVPFTILEYVAEADILGKVVVADYKKIKKSLVKPKVESKDINEVMESLRNNLATKNEVTRPAKLGDEVIIDFEGVDTKKQSIKGANGKDYALTIGSKAFIPGFEDNLIGLKQKEQKSFDLRFPKNYGVKDLANKKVVFTVMINRINEVVKPKIDDEFASKVGPFKSVADLKADIKKHLLVEKQNQAERALENEIVLEIVDKSEVDLPETLVSEQIERLKTEVRQNLTYRGQTWQEMLDVEGLSEDQFVNQQLKPEAERRVKTGLVLSEISIKEDLDVTAKELDVRIKELEGQYQDQAMQEELAKPEAKQDIASRMITEKTVKRLVELATK